MSSVATLPSIPTPIAPARPYSSSDIIYGTDASGNVIAITPTTASNLATGQVTQTSPLGSGTLGADLQNALSNLANLGAWSTGAVITPSTAASVSTGVSSAVDKAKSLAVSSLVFSSRLIILVIGIILIAAGVMSFKATETVIKTAAKVAP